MSMKESLSQAQRWMSEFAKKKPRENAGFSKMVEAIEKEEGESLDKKN